MTGKECERKRILIRDPQSGKLCCPEERGLLAGLFCAALMLHLLGIGCTIRWLTGIPCAGCGMSRALLELLQGHLREALAYHPLAPAVPPALILWLGREHLPDMIREKLQKIYPAAGICLALLFFVVYLIRMAHGDPVLETDIKEGVIWKALSFIFSSH